MPSSTWPRCMHKGLGLNRTTPSRASGMCVRTYVRAGAHVYWAMLLCCAIDTRLGVRDCASVTMCKVRASAGVGAGAKEREYLRIHARAAGLCPFPSHPLLCRA